MAQFRCLCDAFVKAQTMGTGSESYGKLIEIEEGELLEISPILVRVPSAYMMGCGLPPISFCPWCGNPVPEIPVG